MDIKIENGDILLNDCHEAVMIKEREQLVQQIKILLSVRKGCFIYDRLLGTDIDSIDSTEPHACKTITAMLNEGLINFKDTYVNVKSIYTDNDKLCVVMDVKNGRETFETEVRING